MKQKKKKVKKAKIRIPLPLKRSKPQSTKSGAKGYDRKLSKKELMKIDTIE